MQIFCNLAITAPHILVLETERMEAYGIILACLDIITKHVSIFFILYNKFIIILSQQQR